MVALLDSALVARSSRIRERELILFEVLSISVRRPKLVIEIQTKLEGKGWGLLGWHVRGIEQGDSPFPRPTMIATPL